MTGRKLLDQIIIALTLLTTIATVGVFVYTNVIYKKELPSNQKELTSLKEDFGELNFPSTYVLDKITLNLESATRRLRFLDVQINLVLFNQDDSEILDQYKPQIYDIVIDVAAAISPEELNSLSGKLIFESRIKKRINELVKKRVVKEVFYSKFVVQ
ncbi:flagellar basal body-associated protein FliL [Halobacteriovorax sp. BALOs_7]|uniref:Flagellar protein FliL n=1 Tax=Halobacteriovorax vibrionivorans TaxID=2152716 RepID=A0ABY0IDC4_9BACT|nr:MULTISPECIES: flagellar basal body-associated FliL family protein [Halobacteriovorax]AYF44883.1 flagellar basal body-associated protein FliL [Halobacteriovorax sp. BALOs_7]RZF20957.1 flagellar basal body-associated FliL family protein [Halobacteriovorax vibrionivorans]TGD46057.1 flagellar basal body-associated FliL family protein [Halobacteriovorax sp. Y22]